MSSAEQIAHYLRNCKWFAGVYPSDKLPDPASLHPGSAIIANTNSTATPPGHVGHWIAILALNDRSKPPEYMDPYGFLPDDSDSILGVKTNFRRYLVGASTAAGHGGAFRSSAVEIECADSDVCGELSVYAVLNGMPAAPSGAIRMPWKHIVHVMKNAGCKIGDQLVQALVPLKKS